MLERHWVYFTCLMTTVTCSAAIHHVPADYGTIQSAIFASANHDTVLVAPGTYHENLNFSARSIVLASHFLTTGELSYIEATVINGDTPQHSDSGSVIAIISGEDSTTQVVGFTITGGTGTRFRDQSDGLYYTEGGGIIVEESAPHIQHNIITGNDATRRPAGTQSAGGGGIRAGFCNVRITNNVIRENSGRYGGGIVIFFANALISNNVIVHNSGGQDYGGGGLWVGGATGFARVNNNTIAGNASTNQPGGGVRCFGATVHGTNNIVWGNSANQGAQISGSANSTRFIFSDVQGGYVGTGNVLAYPRFRDEFLLLENDSPGLDSGNDSTLYNDRDGSRNDMGAYGGPQATALMFPCNPIIFVSNAILDFGSVHVGEQGRQARAMENRGTATLIIDSIRIGETARDVVTITAAPVELGPFEMDSLILVWTPLNLNTLADSVRIYHQDSATSNPQVVPISGSTLDIPESLPVTYNFELSQNYPNPFNGSTDIRFELPAPAHAILEIVDIEGRLVARLLDAPLAPGMHSVYWRPQALASGLYFCRLRAGQQSAIRKMVFLQ